MTKTLLCAANAGGPGSTPGQGTGFHRLQLRVCILNLKKQKNKKQSSMLQLRPGTAKYINNFLKQSRHLNPHKTNLSIKDSKLNHRINKEKRD